MKKIILLDFGTGEVHVFSYDSAAYEDAEQFIQEMVEKEIITGTSGCEWMIVDKLNIQIH